MEQVFLPDLFIPVKDASEFMEKSDFVEIVIQRSSHRYL
jgi:hypothetical protein